jgi:hypothetical protein
MNDAPLCCAARSRAALQRLALALRFGKIQRAIETDTLRHRLIDQLVDAPVTDGFEHLRDRAAIRADVAAREGIEAVVQRRFRLVRVVRLSRFFKQSRVDLVHAGRYGERCSVQADRARRRRNLLCVERLHAVRLQPLAKFSEMLVIARLHCAEDVNCRDVGPGEGAVVHHLFDARASRGDLAREIGEAAGPIADHRR